MVKEIQGQKTCSEVLDTKNYYCRDISRNCLDESSFTSTSKPCDKRVCADMCSIKRKGVGKCGIRNLTCHCVYKCP